VTVTTAWTPPIEPPTPPMPAPPRPRRRRSAFLLGVAALALVGVSVLATVLLMSGSKPKPLHAVGVMTLVGDSTNVTADGGSCHGIGGWNDIMAGAQVTVTDAAGSTVAITQLSEGIGTTDSCDFDWSAQVPAGAKFYGVEVAHRGRVQFTPQQLVTDASTSLTSTP
jgi:hypothetical protein